MEKKLCMVIVIVCIECLIECYRDIKKKSKSDLEYDFKILYVFDFFFEVIDISKCLVIYM